MVRRGSTVRIRQRALQKPRKRAFLLRDDLQNRQRAVGMEPFMEPSDRKLGPEMCVAPRFECYDLNPDHFFVFFASLRLGSLGEDRR